MKHAIEAMFHQWKAYLTHISLNIDWYTVHMSALPWITPQQGLNYFRNTTSQDLVENHPLSIEHQQKTEDELFLLAATVALLMQ